MSKCDYDALPDNAKKGGSEVYLSEITQHPVPFDKLLQNYSKAYYELFTDKFFLMDPPQIVNMYNNEDILGSGYYHQYKAPALLGSYPPYNYPYWIMAPHDSTENFCLSLDNNLGTFYAQPATWIEIYARATFYLDPTEEFLGGNGTKNTPYNFTLFTKGKGTEQSPYEIGDFATLKKFRDRVNAGYDFAGDYIKLTANISMLNEYNEANGNSWTPIGTSNASGSAQGVFNGTFDGNGKTISGLYINSSKDAALFLHTGKKAVIKNLNVSGTISVTGDDAAGICVSNEGTIQGCTYNGSVDGANHLGGICAYNYGTISRCINNGEVVGTGSYMGGICADNRKAIENCYNIGRISGSKIVGGICGSNYSADTSVENCHDYGMIINGEYIGCICGKNDNPTGVSACYYLDYDGSCEIGNGNYADGATALQLTEFNAQSSFVGFDFDNIWEMGHFYPVLRGVTEPDTLYYFKKGHGTKTSPFEIPDLATLEKFRNSVNSGTSYQGLYVKLTADIDMSAAYNAENGKSWTPIGTLANNKKYLFKGNFSGGGHTISGLYQCASSSIGALGLFTDNEGGLIEKLTVSGTIIAPNDTATVGGICGTNNGGTIRECVNNCDVSGKGFAMVGGICGYMDKNGKIERCYNTGSISCDAAHAGGIVGHDYSGSVKNCYNIGAISSGSGQYTRIGGVCGCANSNNTTNIENSYNYGTVSPGYDVAWGTEGFYGGGDDPVQSCYYNTDAYATAHATMGKTAEQFKSQQTFVGWDFDNVWEMNEMYGRPTLRAVPEHRHDMSVECGHSNIITFDKALTSKDGMLYINGDMVALDGWDDPGDSYWYIALPEGNYYLADNIELEHDISVYNKVNLCLNGHTLNMGENSIEIYDRSAKLKGDLNICDCCENGTITGTEHSSPNFDAKIMSCSNFSLYGGKVINTSDNTDADVKKYAISTYGGTAKIFGGEVVSLKDDAIYLASDDELKHPGLLYLSGAPKISGTADKADIYVANGGQGAGIIIDAPLTATKPYRVAADENNIFTYQWTKHMEDKNFSDYFTSAAADSC